MLTLVLFIFCRGRIVQRLPGDWVHAAQFACPQLNPRLGHVGSTCGESQLGRQAPAAHTPSTAPCAAPAPPAQLPPTVFVVSDGQSRSSHVSYLLDCALLKQTGWKWYWWQSDVLCQCWFGCSGCSWSLTNECTFKFEFSSEYILSSVSIESNITVLLYNYNYSSYRDLRLLRVILIFCCIGLRVPILQHFKFQILEKRVPKSHLQYSQLFKILNNTYG